jgi:hypothetical protein
LHSPQLLYASGIRPDALGRHINDHYQVTKLIEMDTEQPMESMSWIPSANDWLFSVTIAPTSAHTLPFPATFNGQPVFIGVFCASDLSSRKISVLFDESKPDWLGLPSISIKAHKTADDLARLEQGKELVHADCGTIGRPAEGFETIVLPVGSSLHYQGTIRMGAEDDGTSVCNQDSQVWCFDNLYVAGNGIIPTVTASNPTLFSVALATLGARHVCAQSPQSLKNAVRHEQCPTLFEKAEPETSIASRTIIGPRGRPGPDGTSHALAYHKHPGFHVVGLVNRSTPKLPQELSGYPVRDDYLKALAELSPQVVSIATHTNTHADMAVAALESGAHVFVEKPLAANVADAERVVAAAKANGRKLVVGYILRHHPSWMRMIDESRKLGGPYVFRMNLNQQSSGSAWDIHRSIMQTTSPIVDCGVHYVDVMCQITDSKPVEVRGMGLGLAKGLPSGMYNYGHFQVSSRTAALAGTRPDGDR